MALDFPSNPTNGQVYDNFIYSSAKGTWKSLSAGASPSIITNAVISATASNATTVPLTVNGAVSQSANLQEWKNGAGLNIAIVNSLGDYSSIGRVIGTTPNDSGSTGGVAIKAPAGGTQTSAYLQFVNNAYNAQWAAIEATPSSVMNLSANQVRVPNQPSFQARRDIGHNTASGNIVFDYVWHNTGNAYNNTNGRFTAPVAGRYLFTFSTLLWSMGSSSNVYLAINGTSQAFMGTYGQFTGSYAGQSATQVVNLNAGDYVQWYFAHSGTNLHQTYTNASGYFLG